MVLGAWCFCLVIEGSPCELSKMSTSRVAGADDMAVDEAGGVAPSREWMEAAQRAADTDGILENGPAKRQKVCNPCY